MRLATVVACAALAVSTASAATTFATFIPYSGSTLDWGGCTTGCTTTAKFNYVGGIKNYSPYDTMLIADVAYDWAPVGSATAFSVPGVGTEYYEYVTGYFSFSFTPPGQSQENLLTVDFSAANGLLLYNPFSADLSLILTPGTSGAANAPIMTSSIVTFAPGSLSDWAFTIDFGNTNPGIGESGNINNFTSGFNGIVGSSPLPAGQIPEPASMLMAGAGLLAVGGLLRFRRFGRK